MSTIKVDTIATRTGSGNITLSNNVASLTSSGAISGTTITATANGAPLTVNSINSNNNKIIFQDNGSAVSHLGGISNGLVFANAAGTQLGRLDAEGLKFGTDTASANGLDDYEEGTWTANLIGSTGNPSTAVTSAAATYTKIGRMVYARWMIGPVNVAGASGGIRVNGLPFNNAGGHVSGNVMLYYRKSTPYTDAINLTPYVSGNQVYLYLTRDGYADVWAEILFDLTGASTNFYMYASVVYETAS